ncbi:MAG: divalent-cation tolerance protein CutA [Gemmatimonadota bacterium]
MSSLKPVAVILVSGPDLASMRELANTVVNERLAACANLLPGAVSVYRWEGRIETAEEVMVILKTVPDRAELLERRVSELHPYEVPEVVVLTSTGGSRAYADWVHDCVEGE